MEPPRLPETPPPVLRDAELLALFGVCEKDRVNGGPRTLEGVGRSARIGRRGRFGQAPASSRSLEWAASGRSGEEWDRPEPREGPPEPARPGPARR